MRAPPSLVVNAAAFFSSTANMIASPFGQNQVLLSPGPAMGEFDLREDEVMEEERGEEGEVDDSLEPRRNLRVISMPMSWAAGVGGPMGGSPQSRERRRWEIVPLLKERMKNQR